MSGPIEGLCEGQPRTPGSWVRSGWGVAVDGWTDGQGGVHRTRGSGWVREEATRGGRGRAVPACALSSRWVGTGSLGRPVQRGAVNVGLADVVCGSGEGLGMNTMIQALLLPLQSASRTDSGTGPEPGGGRSRRPRRTVWPGATAKVPGTLTMSQRPLLIAAAGPDGPDRTCRPRRSPEAARRRGGEGTPPPWWEPCLWATASEHPAEAERQPG